MSETAVQVARKARIGMVWTVGTGFLTRGLGLATTLLLTGYMSPEESGAVNVAATLILTATVLSTIGLGQYVASQRKPSAQVAWNAMLLHVSMGTIGLLLALAFRHPLCRVFGAAESAEFIPPLVLAALMERVGYIPERVLVAHMHFGPVSIMRSVGELSYCGGAILGALWGYGPWCIVIGNLARQAVRLGLTFHYAPLREWFVREGMRPDILAAMARFGLPVMLASVFGFAARRWDNLLLSHYYGPMVLGLYNLAYNLAEVPAVQIAEMVSEVLAPSFARLEGDERRQAAIEMVGALALCVFPLAVGLAVVAPTIAAIMPPRWQGIWPYLMGLSVLSLARPMALVLGVYLQALRKTLPAALLQIIQVVVLVVSLCLIGMLFPTRPVLVCVGVGITFLAGSLVGMYLLMAIDGVSASKLLRVQLQPLPALIVMSLCAHGVTLLRLPVHPGLLLGLQAVLGGAGYIGGALVFMPAPTRRLLDKVAGLLKKR